MTAEEQIEVHCINEPISEADCALGVTVLLKFYKN